MRDISGYLRLETIASDAHTFQRNLQRAFRNGELLLPAPPTGLGRNHIPTSAYLPALRRFFSLRSAFISIWAAGSPTTVGVLPCARSMEPTSTRLRVCAPRRHRLLPSLLAGDEFGVARHREAVGHTREIVRDPARVVAVPFPRFVGQERKVLAMNPKQVG